MNEDLDFSLLHGHIRLVRAGHSERHLSECPPRDRGVPGCKCQSVTVAVLKGKSVLGDSVIPTVTQNTTTCGPRRVIQVAPRAAGSSMTGSGVTAARSTGCGTTSGYPAGRSGSSSSATRSARSTRSTPRASAPLPSPPRAWTPACVSSDGGGPLPISTSWLDAFSPELEKEEQSLDRLRRWYRDLRARDLLASPPASVVPFDRWQPSPRCCPPTGIPSHRRCRPSGRMTPGSSAQGVGHRRGPGR